MSAPDANGWMPIESAPRDRTEVLLHGLGGGGIYIGFWNGRTWDDGDFFDDIGIMSHWQPLPKPPVSEANK